MRFLLFLGIILAAGIPASAELNPKYAPVYVDDAEPSLFFLFGEIDSRTALNLDRAIEEFGTPEILVLSSDGGLVTQALIAARKVRALQIKTLVPADAGCYSACALVFLAGTVRVVDGELGVHQISSDSGDLTSGQVAISDILDVLGDFDVPNGLLVDMFRTPPEEMHILSRDEVFEYGFLLRDETVRNSGTGPSLEERAVALMLDLNGTWSESNDIALSKIETLYGPSIQFYGKTLSRADVMAEKIAFAKRWPERVYVVQPETLSVSCRVSTCVVSGNVAWDARSAKRGAVSTGVAYSELTVQFTGDTAAIIGEDGHVLTRD